MDRWVPAERKIVDDEKWLYFALTTQTFSNVSGVIHWLDEHGFIVHKLGDEGEYYWENWGNPYFAVPVNKAIMIT